MTKRSRKEWEDLEDNGYCPECRQLQYHCLPTCRKKWFDAGFATGYHDGANRLGGHESAFFVYLFDQYDEFDE